MILGSSATGLGIASLGLMVSGMGLGARIERRGAALATDTSSQYQDFQVLLRKGSVYNTMAWATGVVGGALLISGTAVLATALGWRRGARDQARVRLVPDLHGLEVRF